MRSWHVIFIKLGVIGDNQECLKQTFEESHFKYSTCIVRLLTTV